MNRILLPALVVISISSAAQSTFKHPFLLTVSFFGNDFENKKPLSEGGGLDAGLSIGFLKGMNRRFDWQVWYSASFPDSFSKKHNASKEKKFLSELDYAIRTRIFAKETPVQPYLLTGLGVGFVKSEFSCYWFVGPGLQWRFKDVHIQINAVYKPTIAGNLNRHYVYGFGVGGRINAPKGKAKKAAVPVSSNLTPVVTDTDADGIVDSADRCPTKPGLLRFDGCPDSDSDGIADTDDQCPSTYGIKKISGLPCT